MQTSINYSSVLFYLLQVANTSFPTGSFNHSLGFETLIQEGYVNNAETLEKYCADWLLYGLAPTEGVAVAWSYRLALDEDVDKIVELDKILSSVKIARELRDASARTGRAFLKAFVELFGGSKATRYLDLVNNTACKGHHSIAFGIAAADMLIPEGDVILAFMHMTLSNIVSVAARLIPLGQVESQRTIIHLWPLLLQCSTLASSRKYADFYTNTSWIDIAAMQHEYLYSRLCMS